MPFQDIGVVIELDFQANFSNVLDVYVIVRNRGITRECVAFLNSWPPVSENMYLILTYLA